MANKEIEVINSPLQLDSTFIQDFTSLYETNSPFQLDSTFVQNFIDENDRGLAEHYMTQYVEFLITTVIKNLLDECVQQTNTDNSLTLEQTNLFSQTLFLPNDNKRHAFGYQQAVQDSNFAINHTDFTSLFTILLQIFIKDTHPNQNNHLEPVIQCLSGLFNQHLSVAQPKQQVLYEIKRKHGPN